jgi:hypothetical protein
MASPDAGVMSFGAPAPAVIETDTASSFVCDYVAGVNRVLSLAPYLLVDNIGRNIEVWRFQKNGLEPIERARYDRTSHPGDPIASLLDVDLHAAFVRGAGHELLTINHYGRMRRFTLPALSVELQSAGELQLLGDVERYVMANDCFIGSSPRGEFTEDALQTGVFLFAPLPRLLETSTTVTRLSFNRALADWGLITALAVSPSGGHLAVGAGTRVGIFALHADGTRPRIGLCAWEANVAFESQWLHFDDTALLASGFLPSPEAASGDWNACRGGAIQVLAIDSGARISTVSLPEETAWGYGADPIVPTPDNCRAYVLGRDASLHVADIRKGVTHPLYPSPLTVEAAGLSLGIGHATLRDRWIYAGFSRGGFRLFRYDLNQD